MEIQNISGADSVARGFHPDPTPREEVNTREVEESVENRPSTEPEKGQNIDTRA